MCLYYKDVNLVKIVLAGKVLKSHVTIISQLVNEITLITVIQFVQKYRILEKHNALFENYVKVNVLHLTISLASSTTKLVWFNEE